MTEALVALLCRHLREVAADAATAADEALLEAWLACWALACWCQSPHPEAGPGDATAGTSLRGQARALLQGRFGAESLTLAEGEQTVPVPTVQAAAALALWQEPLRSEPVLEPARLSLSRDLSAAWRPAGRLAFSQGALPAQPTPLQEALAVAAWAGLPELVPERRAVRGRKLLVHLLAERPPQAAAVIRLWAAERVATATGLVEAKVLLRKLAQACAGTPRPATSRDLAGRALALSAVATLPAETGIGPAKNLSREAWEREAWEREAWECLQGIADDGGAEAVAAALALVALTLLPEDGPVVRSRPALRLARGGRPA